MPTSIVIDFNHAQAVHLARQAVAPQDYIRELINREMASNFYPGGKSGVMTGPPPRSDEMAKRESTPPK